MNKKEYLSTLQKLKKEYGKLFSKYFRVRKNYPYGVNSECCYIIEKKSKNHNFHQKAIQRSNTCKSRIDILS